MSVAPQQDFGARAAASLLTKYFCTPDFAVQYLAAVITMPPLEDGFAEIQLGKREG
jgi:hypothetical protein